MCVCLGQAMAGSRGNNLVGSETLAASDRSGGNSTYPFIGINYLLWQDNLKDSRNFLYLKDFSLKHKDFPFKLKSAEKRKTIT